MKTEQEQIEEIVKILLESSKKCFDTDCDYCDKQYEKDCAQYRKATALVRTGYGDIKQAQTDTINTIVKYCENLNHWNELKDFKLWGGKSDDLRNFLNGIFKEVEKQ